MLLGARHFADTQGASYRPLFGILLDMVGERDARFLGSRTASPLRPRLCAGYGTSPRTWATGITSGRRQAPP